MKEIQLTQGKVTQVDDADFTWLSQWKWHYDQGYAVRTTPKLFGKQKIVYMHREIMQSPTGTVTDHVRVGDTLNNQRYNLRVCSSTENSRNRKMPINNTSGYKGVTQCGKKWKAKIVVDRKSIYLGLFSTKLEAAQVYDEAAKKYHGGFAGLNF